MIPVVEEAYCPGLLVAQGLADPADVNAVAKGVVNIRLVSGPDELGICREEPYCLESFRSETVLYRLSTHQDSCRGDRTRGNADNLLYPFDTLGLREFGFALKESPSAMRAADNRDEHLKDNEQRQRNVMDCAPQAAGSPGKDGPNRFSHPTGRKGWEPRSGRRKLRRFRWPVCSQ